MIGGPTRGVAHYQGRALQKAPRSGTAAPRPSWRQRVVQSTRVFGLTLGITLASVAAPVIGEVVVNSALLAVRGIEVKGTRVLTPAQLIDMTYKDLVVLDPADPRALQRQAQAHRLEEQTIAASAVASRAAADSLARLASLPRQASLGPPAPPGLRTAAAAGRPSTTSHRSLPPW